MAVNTASSSINNLDSRINNNNNNNNYNNSNNRIMWSFLDSLSRLLE